MKTKHIGKRMLAIFFALAFCLTLLPMTAMAAVSADDIYVPVNASQLKDGGEYLIVNADKTTALSNSGTFATTASVTFNNNGTVTGVTDSCIWKVSGSISSFTLANNSGYLSGHESYPGLAVTSSSSNRSTWVVDGDGGPYLPLTYYGQTNYALVYNSSTFDVATASKTSNVLFYEKQAPKTVTGVTITPDTASVNVGATVQLSATVNGSTGVSQDVTWTSGNETTATVDSNGLVTGHATGTVAITATSVADNTKFANCNVTVSAGSVAVTGVTLDQHNLTLTAGGATATLTAAIAPENATDKRLEWVSGDINVATVDNNGVVTPVGEGKTIIGVMAVTGANDSCEVTVSAAPAPAGKTYELKDTIQDGKNYLIVSSNAAGAAVALKNDNGVGSAAVTIADGKITANDASIVWKASGSTSSFTLENGSGAFLQRSTNDLGIGDTATSWNWQYGVPMNGDRALTYNNGFVLTYVPYEDAIANNKVYFFEEQPAPTPVTEYNITLVSGENGTVTADKTKAEEGETVTLTITPAEGYQLDTLTVRNGIVDILVDNDNAFTMPDGDVTVTASFQKIVSVTGVTVTPDTASVNVGETVQLAATVSGSEGVSQEVTWSTANPSIATVNDDGVVTGVGEGEIAITATSKVNNTKFASCLVTVEPAPAPTGKTYKKVDTLTAGKNYLIVADGNAVKNDKSAVAVPVSGDTIISNDADLVWTTGSSGTGFTLKNNQDTYLGIVENEQLVISSSALAWSWDDRSSAYVCGGYNYTVMWTGTGFVASGADRTSYTGYKQAFFYEEQEDAEPKFTNKQLVLSGQIGVIFKMDLSMLSAEQRADSAMEFEVDSEEGARAAVTYDAYDETTGIATYTCFVNSLQMADEITATFTYDDDKEVVATASVKDYVDYIIEHGSEAEYSRYVELAKAIKDYGHYAQDYLASVHDFTIGTDYAAMDPYHTSLTRPADEALQAFKPSFNKGENDVTGLALKLSLDSETALTIRPVVSGGAELTGGVTFAGKTIDFAEGKAKVEGIKASQLAANVTISGSAGGTLTGSASALSYAYVVLKGGSSDAKLQNLAIALYNYYVETSKL